MAQAYAIRQEVHQETITTRKRDNNLAAVIGGLVIALAITSQVIFAVTRPEPEVADPTPTATFAPAPDPSISENREWVGELTLNDVKLDIVLDGINAPQATAALVTLVNEDFYKDVTCHRLTTTPGFYLLQCGDPNGDGTGGPDFRFGPIENAPSSAIYPKGTIAYARAGSNASSMGSQFFITLDDSTILPDNVGGYSVVGHVVDGLENLISEITSKGTADGSEDGVPLVKTVITGFKLS
ncbi:MAG: peptidylprolyl isomerase [Microbacteriaceae bacterium]|nr:peptidylprolyl isomerase [Microbacteriaceae bacterium]